MLATASNDLYATVAANQNMSSTSITSTGGGQAHENMTPFQCVNYIIALQGTYPSRN